MTTVVVNDASCLIDLHKGQLLSVMLTLPYRFVVPLPIRHAEALDLTDRDWRILEDAGLFTFDLPPELVEEAMKIKTAHRKLSANDCLCLVSTGCQERGILAYRGPAVASSSDGERLARTRCAVGRG